MRRILLDLWNDERGSMSTEWALITTVLVLGAVTGTILTQALESPAEALPTIRTLR
jgi:Flp pilus assembly pilin Flp